jgi:hypothetical protein
VPDRRPEGQVGRVDVLHGRVCPPGALRSGSWCPGAAAWMRGRDRVRRALAASRTLEQ